MWQSWTLNCLLAGSSSRFWITSLICMLPQMVIKSSTLTHISSTRLLLAISCGNEGCFCRWLVCHRLDRWMSLVLMARVGIGGNACLCMREGGGECVCVCGCSSWLFMQAKWTISHSFIYIAFCICIIIIMAAMLEQAGSQRSRKSFLEQSSSNHCKPRTPNSLWGKLLLLISRFYEPDKAFNWD